MASVMDFRPSALCGSASLSQAEYEARRDACTRDELARCGRAPRALVCLQLSHGDRPPPSSPILH